MTTLKPGQVLTGDSVKALKAGSSVLLMEHIDRPVIYRDRSIYTDLLVSEERFTQYAAKTRYLGEQDAEGWIAWTGGENPVPGMRVEVLFEGEFLHGTSETFDWSLVSRFRPLSTKPQGEDQGSSAAPIPTEQAEAAVLTPEILLSAKRFDALMRCCRIKMQGSSGVDPHTLERNGNNVHFGAELWPEPIPEGFEEHYGQSTLWGRACLMHLADAILEQEAAIAKGGAA